MNGNEIRERIDALNEFISEKLTPLFFTLNEEVKRAQEEIESLRKVCAHHYENGRCIYCDEEEEEEE